MPEHIVILMGGPGGEAEVSRNTAKSIEVAVIELGLSYSKLEFVETSWKDDLLALKPTFVFIAMHGSPGEDGTVQAELEKMNLPYNGSDEKSSAHAMDKSSAKKSFIKAGVNVAKEDLIPAGKVPENADELSISFPAVFKPNHGGSSVGIEIVQTKEDWPAAYKRLSSDESSDDSILVEEFIAGRELTIPVLSDHTIGVMEITSEGYEFYDYNSKYKEGGSAHIYPAPIATEVYKEAEQFALNAHKSLGCTGVTRVDLRYNEKENRLVVLEVNTLPGMTATSLVPDVASHNGISFSELIAWIIKDGKCQHRGKN